MESELYFQYILKNTIDCHVHIGQFNDLYFSPQEIAQDLVSIGLKKWFVTTTSTCDQVFNYKKIADEINRMMLIAPNQVLPVLWVTPSMLSKSEDLSLYWDFDYYMIKIHPKIHRWELNGDPIKQIFSIAAKKNVPLLIHTGGRDDCDAGVFLDLCKIFTNVKIILGHGRPGDQALAVLKACPNVYVDTAFMPINDIFMLINSGMEDRIFFGSDYPMDKIFFPELSSMDLYLENTKTIVNSISEAIAEKICYRNAMNCFHLT